MITSDRHASEPHSPASREDFTGVVRTALVDLDGAETVKGQGWRLSRRVAESLRLGRPASHQVLQRHYPGKRPCSRAVPGPDS
jgi:hypothetical protein